MQKRSLSPATGRGEGWARGPAGGGAQAPPPPRQVAWVCGFRRLASLATRCGQGCNAAGGPTGILGQLSPQKALMRLSQEGVEGRQGAEAKACLFSGLPRLPDVEGGEAQTPLLSSHPAWLPAEEAGGWEVPTCKVGGPQRDGHGGLQGLPAKSELTSPLWVTFIPLTG